ncbi:hypothetical protein H5410_019238 [Solanum commersonii]|uniref:Uncharacterized protein n=1 Tax=Solanum commersonii TaxID=4109 RepID=A0A9J6A458_SOLCO|nr:hypothetical protein H5410_019238 [Solanum commersonii]
MAEHTSSCTPQAHSATEQVTMPEENEKLCWSKDILRENHKAEANISGSESTCFRDGKKEIDMICFFVFFFCPLVERQMKM